MCCRILYLLLGPGKGVHIPNQPTSFGKTAEYHEAQMLRSARIWLVRQWRKNAGASQPAEAFPLGSSKLHISLRRKTQQRCAPPTLDVWTSVLPMKTNRKAEPQLHHRRAADLRVRTTQKAQSPEVPSCLAARSQRAASPAPPRSGHKIRQATCLWSRWGLHLKMS